MIKILTVIGARPQIIKAAAISRTIKAKYQDKLKEIIVHTGQHYDANMSRVFFEELNVPEEDYNLEAGSGSHAQQTALMMVKVEEILLRENPDCLLLYGDTNSTLAAAVAAAKIHIPIIHVEGGVRSFNKKFPEEVNRLICDHLSALIFIPTPAGLANMVKEGFNLNNKPPYTFDNPGVFHCGDIMYDNSLFFANEAAHSTTILDQLGIIGKKFTLVTLHRPSNVDNPETLRTILETINDLANTDKSFFILPLHPRTLHAIKKNIDPVFFDSIRNNEFIKIIPAVSFLEVIMLEKNSAMVITDSGGVQKEAFYFQRPCIILLDETPWVELVESGSAILTGADEAKIKAAFNLFNSGVELHFPNIFGDGKAAEFICEEIYRNFKVN